MGVDVGPESEATIIPFDHWESRQRDKNFHQAVVLGQETGYRFLVNTGWTTTNLVFPLLEIQVSVERGRGRGAVVEDPLPMVNNVILWYHCY